MADTVRVWVATAADAAALAELNAQFNGVLAPPEQIAAQLARAAGIETALLGAVSGHVAGFACVRITPCVCYAEPAAELTERAQLLNTKRKELFGGRELSVVANVRVRTENNCVPRDVAEVAGRLLLGFNVFIGMKAEPSLSDVFSVHELSEGAGEWEAKELDLEQIAYLQDAGFKREFAELFAYYKAARLSQLRTPEGRLLHSRCRPRPFAGGGRLRRADGAALP